MKISKLKLMVLTLLMSNIGFADTVPAETLNELNQSVSGYINGLNSGNSAEQRKYVCQQDSGFFDLTSPLSVFLPIMKFFTGDFSAGELSDIKVIADDKIDAQSSIIGSKNPNMPNVGRVTFVKEEGNWKTCNLRH